MYILWTQYYRNIVGKCITCVTVLYYICSEVDSKCDAFWYITSSQTWSPPISTISVTNACNYSFSLGYYCNRLYLSVHLMSDDAAVLSLTECKRRNPLKNSCRLLLFEFGIFPKNHRLLFFEFGFLLQQGTLFDILKYFLSTSEVKRLKLAWLIGLLRIFQRDLFACFAD